MSSGEDILTVVFSLLGLVTPSFKFLSFEAAAGFCLVGLGFIVGGFRSYLPN
jgi:hypothetical protein